MTSIYVAEEHVQVYDLWKRRGERGLELSHIDFHCDMRGLLIDRGRRRAYQIDRTDPRMRVIDSGNFLGHAIMQGIVRSVRWIHAEHGGRRYDTGTVKYETDLTALPHRLMHRLRGGPEVELDFEDLTFDAWDGVRPGEQLDIDWDGIASVEYEPRMIRALVEEFLARDFRARPESVYLVYSPGYSHPDVALFEDFAARLAQKLEASITRLPAYAGPPHHATPLSGGEALERRVVLGLKRLGIY